MEHLRSALLILFVALSLPLSAQNQEHALPLPDRSECELARRQKLKVSLRFGYLADNREASSLRVRTEYNLKGYPLYIYRFDNEGEIHEKLRYEYNASDTLVRKAVVEKYRHGELDLSLSYRADPAGHLAEVIETDAEGRSFRTAYTRDPAGRLLSIQVFEPDGLPGASEVRAYDAAGNCTEVIEYEIAGTAKRRRTMEYNAQNQLTEEVHYLHSNTLLFRLAYSYDDRGRCIRQDRSSASGKPLGYETWAYKTGETEHLTLEPGQATPLRELIHYDLAGKETERIVFDNDGSVFQWFQYAYDSTGTGAGLRRLREKGQIDMEEIAVYDQQGRVIEKNTKYPDGSGDLHVDYRYDDSGLPLEEKHQSFGQEAAVYWFVFERY